MDKSFYTENRNSLYSMLPAGSLSTTRFLRTAILYILPVSPARKPCCLRARMQTEA